MDLGFLIKTCDRLCSIYTRSIIPFRLEETCPRVCNLLIVLLDQTIDALPKIRKHCPFGSCTLHIDDGRAFVYLTRSCPLTWSNNFPIEFSCSNPFARFVIDNLVCTPLNYWSQSQIIKSIISTSSNNFVCIPKLWSNGGNGGSSLAIYSMWYPSLEPMIDLPFWWSFILRSTVFTFDIWLVDLPFDKHAPLIQYLQGSQLNHPWIWNIWLVYLSRLIVGSPPCRFSLTRSLCNSMVQSPFDWSFVSRFVVRSLVGISSVSSYSIRFSLNLVRISANSSSHVNHILESHLLDLCMGFFLGLC